jgi:hypothetical protein
MPRKLTLESMNKLAKLRRGKCLSKKYVNAHSKLLWQCVKGHQWLAIPNNIQQGTWCPFCGGWNRLTIDEMRKIAAARGGKCLSKKYVNNLNKLLWECRHGHLWEATPANIKRGKWCPICAGRTRLTLEEFKKIAEERGGRCISTEYVNNWTALVWECSEGHQWKAIPNSIKRGTWCRVCAGLDKPPLQYLRDTAKKRGGKCLSSTYSNARTKLLWECSEGHRWKATWDKIRQGRWCPQCSSGLGERICREFFQQLFRCRFPKYRPTWLINNEGNQMELDGFCKSLNLAFEHQGEQHYSTNNPFITSEKTLFRRQEDDRSKRELCTKHGITLIQVPAVPDRVPTDKLKLFIKRQCNRYSVPVLPHFDSIKVSLRKAYTIPSSREMLNQLQAIAAKRGGKCLADAYIRDDADLLWECKEGHRWKAVPSSIKQGSWCPYCSVTLKKTIREMHRLAAQRGGKCISQRYINAKTKLRWQCAKGHKWMATPAQVGKGSWCPICVGRGKTVRELRLIANTRKGKCLSNKYLGARFKHLWQCHNGHKWEATFDSVRRGSWCPYCAGQRKTIVDMRLFAKKHGGKCLSTVYKSSRSKLLWECDKGHQWQAIPSSILFGRWCPTCRSTKLTIEQMHELAKERNGKCLSVKYVNASKKLLWECSEGHQWEAAPKHIKEGRWCPFCGRRRRRLHDNPPRPQASRHL